MLVNCPTCGKPMEPRTGKYGDFFYCQDHGTISKKAVMRAAWNTPNEMATTESIAFNKDPLLTAIKRKGVAMGHHVDEMGELIDWFNDMESAAEDDEDHWMNIRPY